MQELGMGEKRNTSVVEHLARVFGSQAEVGRIVGVDKSTVNRWNHVPAKYHRRLIEEARNRGAALAHADLVA
jgi:hypothetical protein